jgi:anti-sigma factor RsiW
MSPRAQEIRCRQLVELVTDYLEGALPRGVRRRLEKHLAACDACTLYVEQMRAIHRAAGTIRPEELPPDTREGLVAAFHDWAAA